MTQTSPERVDAAESREHILRLVDAGIPVAVIARAVGVSHHLVWGLIKPRARGRQRQHPATVVATVAVDVADRLLALTPAQAEATRSTVPSDTAFDVINALLDAGVPRSCIARRMGQASPASPQMVFDKPARVSRKTHDTLWAMYREWLDGRLEVVYKGKVRRYAAPPLQVKNPLQKFTEILEERIDQNHWRKHAVCANENIPVNVFFPKLGRATNEAEQYCARCPVRDNCLRDLRALTESTVGGMSKRQRRKLFQAEQEAAERENAA